MKNSILQNEWNKWNEQYCIIFLFHLQFWILISWPLSTKCEHRWGVCWRLQQNTSQMENDVEFPCGTHNKMVVGITWQWRTVHFGSEQQPRGNGNARQHPWRRLLRGTGNQRGRGLCVGRGTAIVLRVLRRKMNHNSISWHTSDSVCVSTQDVACWHIVSHIASHGGCDMGHVCRLSHVACIALHCTVGIRRFG